MYPSKYLPTCNL